MTFRSLFGVAVGRSSCRRGRGWNRCSPGRRSGCSYPRGDGGPQRIVTGAVPGDRAGSSRPESVGPPTRRDVGTGPAAVLRRGGSGNRSLRVSRQSGDRRQPADTDCHRRVRGSAGRSNTRRDYSAAARAAQWLPPTPTPTPRFCTTPQPAVGWTCVNGTWQRPVPSTCLTPRPGPDWTCVNGNWHPPGEGVQVIASASPAAGLGVRFDYPVAG